MKCVTIGEKHSYNDFKLLLTSKVISPPSPKLNLLSVPLRDGSIDLTEVLTDEVKYADRKITMEFTMLGTSKSWPERISEIQNYLHGQRLKIVFDDDAAFYYIGRISVNEWISDKVAGKIVIEGSVDPFKYDMQSSAVDWEWDTFDFNQGIINEMGELIVNGSTTVTLICRKKRMFPTFTASADMKVTFDGETHDLKIGSQKVYGIFLCEGENELTFTGNGTIAIDYIGGSL